MSDVFPDRPHEDEALEAVRGLGLDAIEQPAPAPGNPVKGPKAISLDALPSYFRGAKFALVAASRRFPEVPAVKEYSIGFGERMDRYIEAVARTRNRLRTRG